MEKKAKMSDLFIHGENFEFNMIDYSSPKMIKEIERLVYDREQRRKEMDVDLEWMINTYITI